MIFVGFAAMSSFLTVRSQALEAEVVGGKETADGSENVIMVIVIIETHGMIRIVVFTVAETLMSSGTVDDHDVVAQPLEVVGKDLELFWAAYRTDGNSQTFL